MGLYVPEGALWLLYRSAPGEEAEAMSYETTTVKDLYVSALAAFSGLEQKAEAWVEAQNVEAAWEVVKAWYGYLQRGEAAHKYPDPSWEAPPGRKPLTQDLADTLVREIDEDFEIERGRFPRESGAPLSTGLGPEMSRLPPHARMAFAQELYGVVMTAAEIKAEALRLLESGVTAFPPGSKPEPPPSESPAEPGYS